MVSFTSKKLAEKIGVAETLRNAREARNFTLDAAARTLGVAKKYLSAIENGDYNLLPGELYTKNFIRNYANFVKLNSQEVVSAYLKERKNCETKNCQAPPQVCQLKTWDTPRYLQLGASIIVGAGLIYYLGMQVSGIFTAPPLALENPVEGSVSATSVLEVKGQTLPESRVEINGVEKMSNAEGYFSEIINLTPGVNKIMVTAVKKHGRASTILRNVVYDSPEQLY